MEERLQMLEELVQGFIKRMTLLEAETPEFLKDLLQRQQNTLNEITNRIEISNQRYDAGKIERHIAEVRKIMDTMPKAIGVKNHHHFGAWSKSLIIGVLTCFCLTMTAIGSALYLNYRNDQLKNGAFKFWVVSALYPEVSNVIERN